MQKAVNRFWNWLFHPSILRYSHPKGKAFIFRYPTPGNAPLEPALEIKKQDFKTPYQHSKYNVRYSNPIPSQTKHIYEEFSAPGFSTTPIQRLKKAGLLKDGEESNVDAVASAKKKFQEKYKFSVEDRVYKNEMNFGIPSPKREDMAAYIQSYYQGLKEIKKENYDYSALRSTIDDPETVPLESVDMFTDPHFQQERINNQYALDSVVDEIERKKKIDVYVGDARFWKAIDDSFPSTEIQKVQKHVGDEDPLNFEIRPSSVEYEFSKDGQKIVDIHPKH